MTLIFTKPFLAHYFLYHEIFAVLSSSHFVGFQLLTQLIPQVSNEINIAT